MRKNGKKIAVILLLVFVAVGSYYVSGTYAKYTRALSGSDTATVAKFSVSAGDLNKEQNAEIDLFGTIKEDDTTSTEDNVKTGLIAPGTGGQFTIALTNASEVDVEAKITLEEIANGANVPIEYSLDNGNTWGTATNTTVTANLDYVGKTGGTTNKDVVVYWRWAFEGSAADANTKDTQIGETNPAPTVETKVTATFNQVG